MLLRQYLKALQCFEALGVPDANCVTSQLLVGVSCIIINTAYAMHGMTVHLSWKLSC